MKELPKKELQECLMSIFKLVEENPGQQAYMLFALCKLFGNFAERKHDLTSNQLYADTVKWPTGFTPCIFLLIDLYVYRKTVLPDRFDESDRADFFPTVLKFLAETKIDVANVQQFIKDLQTTCETLEKKSVAGLSPS